MTAPTPRLDGLALGDFRATHVVGRDWAVAVKEALADLGPIAGADIGFVYVNDAFAPHFSSIVTLLKQLSPVDLWVGATGIGIAASGVELFGDKALSLMVARLGPDRAWPLGPVMGPAANAGLDEDTKAWIARMTPVFGLVHADPRTPNLADAIGGLTREAGVFLAGGLASGTEEMSHAVGRAVEGGLSGVLFAPEVEVATALSQGCSPIGPPRTITSAEDNVIISIDGRPALDVLKEDMGELLARDLRRAAGYVFAALPIEGSDTGDYLVRNLIGVDANGGFVAIAEQVADGDRIMFTRRDHDAAVKDLDRMLGDLRRRIGERAPKAAIYVSCLARGPNLFGAESEELRQVRAALGDVPLVGFFANGEINNDRLYGYTGVLTVFL